MLSQLMRTSPNGPNTRKRRRAGAGTGRYLLIVAITGILTLVGMPVEGQQYDWDETIFKSFLSELVAQKGPDGKIEGPVPPGKVVITGALSETFASNHYSLVAFQANPVQPDPSKPCSFKLDIWHPMGFHEPLELTLRVQFSFAWTPAWVNAFHLFNVGEASLSGGAWQFEGGPDEFFAYLSFPPEIGQREMSEGTMHVRSGTFRSSEGDVATYLIEPDLLVLAFGLRMIEYVADKHEPRKLDVEGTLGVRLDRTMGGALAGALKGIPKSGDHGMDLQMRTSSYRCVE